MQKDNRREGKPVPYKISGDGRSEPRRRMSCRDGILAVRFGEMWTDAQKGVPTGDCGYFRWTRQCRVPTGDCFFSSLRTGLDIRPAPSVLREQTALGIRLVFFAFKQGGVKCDRIPFCREDV